MAKRRRRNHKPEFKAKVAVEAVKGLKTVSQIADEFQLQSSQVTAWKTQLRKGAPSLFEQPSRKEETPAPTRVGLEAPAISCESLFYEDYRWRFRVGGPRIPGSGIKLEQIIVAWRKRMASACEIS